MWLRRPLSATRQAVLMFVLAIGLVAPAKAMDTDHLAHIALQEEQKLNARLGMAVIDTGSGETWSYRGAERFPLNSTHKAFLCAAILAKADKAELRMEQPVAIDPAKLVSYSPVTEKVPSGGQLTLRQLCAAAVSISDNSAANLLAQVIGGPPAYTAFMRSVGDNVSRLDRPEPDLNTALPGDPRDTTTPLAAASSLRNILFGDVLSARARAELTQWMREDQVADALLRSGLPQGWAIADKTGAGANGARSIVAAIWPPQQPPVVVTIYITETSASMPEADAAIARIGAALGTALQPVPPPPPSR